MSSTLTAPRERKTLLPMVAASIDASLYLSFSVTSKTYILVPIRLFEPVNVLLHLPFNNIQQALNISQSYLAFLYSYLAFFLSYLA